MAKWTIPDMIPRAQADAMVAAALTEAVDTVETEAMHYAGLREGTILDRVTKDIRALITDDAQTALERMLAGARAEGMREAADKAFSLIDPPWDYCVRGVILAAADAIQKEGGA